MSNLLYVSSFLILVFLAGCSTTKLHVEPKLESHDKDNFQKIRSKISYEGNFDYLPPIIKEDTHSPFTVSYEYDVKYVNGSTEYDALNLLNPLVLVGFPLGNEAVIVEGKLTLINKSKKEKLFISSCVAKKTRNLFQNSGSTGPRKKCLMAVRENINDQIIQYKKGVSDEDK